jgi:uncharacterized OsmC-like protein
VRDIPATTETIRATVEGDIEAVENVLRITRIRVHYTLIIPPGKREAAERAVAKHPAGCPAHNSIEGCIDVDIEADITEQT